MRTCLRRLVGLSESQTTAFCAHKWPVAGLQYSSAAQAEVPAPGLSRADFEDLPDPGEQLRWPPPPEALAANPVLRELMDQAEQYAHQGHDSDADDSQPDAESPAQAAGLSSPSLDKGTAYAADATPPSGNMGKQQQLVVAQLELWPQAQEDLKVLPVPDSAQVDMLWDRLWETHNLEHRQERLTFFLLHNKWEAMMEAEQRSVLEHILHTQPLDQLRQLSKPQLQAPLKALGQFTTGNKDVLVQRLACVLATNSMHTPLDIFLSAQAAALKAAVNVGGSSQVGHDNSHDPSAPQAAAEHQHPGLRQGGLNEQHGDQQQNAATAPTGATGRQLITNKKPSIAPRHLATGSCPNIVSAQEVADMLAAAKMDNICMLDVRGRCNWTDHMVIASGRSAQHIQAAAAAVAYQVEQRAAKFIPGLKAGIEGRDSPDWLAVDAGSVVAHCFMEDARQTYDLEGLWVHDDGSNLVHIQGPQTLDTLHAI